MLGVRVTLCCAEISAATLSDSTSLAPPPHLRDSVHVTERSTEPRALPVPNTMGGVPFPVLE